MNGLSGDKLTRDGNIVTKVCYSDPDRFLANAEKQKYFKSPHIKAVPIIEQGISEGRHYIRMMYLKPNYVTDACQLKLVKYLGDAFERCDEMPFNTTIWKNKIEDLKTKIKNQDIISILNVLKKLSSKTMFLYGSDHGDLTFDNILCSGDDVYVIDFLKTFMNTPLNDIVKLRQSSKHNWNNAQHKLLGFDKILETAIKKSNILNTYYVPFQLLNLIRILPYSKEPNTTNHLIKEIKELYVSSYT